MKKKIIVVNTHCIQYYTPLYKKINSNPDIELELFLCSDYGIKSYFDVEFSRDVQWDSQLLDGLSWKVFRNVTLFKNVFKPFWGMLNPSLIWSLRNQPKGTIVWVDSWSQLTLIMAVVFSKLFGHKVYFRCETPLNQELKKNKFKRIFKNALLKLFFQFVDKFLYIGSENKKFYTSLGIKDYNLIFCPYCVDNDYFKSLDATLTFDDENNHELEIISSEFFHTFLFVGKFTHKKRIMFLLDVFKNLNNNKFRLLLIGSGELINEMKSFISTNNLKNISILGFKNQSELHKYYRIANTLILPSGMGETWGLVVNEAMNFNCSLVVSDIIGSSFDLVDEGINGFKFKLDNKFDLIDKIRRVIDLNENEVHRANKDLLRVYNYDIAVENIISSL
jgi:glycosyltransferase involved in cell wall biosynthesis